MNKRNLQGNSKSAGANGLPADIAEVYAPGEGVLLQFACEFGTVDLTTINMEFANRLFAAGYLVKLKED
jgi:hypothetical protein